MKVYILTCVRNEGDEIVGVFASQAGAQDEIGEQVRNGEYALGFTVEEFEVQGAAPECECVKRIAMCAACQPGDEP